MSTAAHIKPLEHKIDVQVRVPGSKSFTNRALIIAALADGTSALHGVSNANDSTILLRFLKQLGVEMEQHDDVLTIKGTGGKFKPFHGVLDVEDAGTVMRFTSALACLIPGETTLQGTERMHQRPVQGLVDALKQLGVDITYLDDEGYPPIKIHGGNCKGGKVEVDASMSSQFVSALLMISPMLPADTEIICKGEMVSLPYIDMTISAMAHFGVTVKHDAHKHYYIKSGQRYKGTDYNIEGDASSASYMFAMAAISGSSVEVTNLSPNSLQSDARFADILQQMGCHITKNGTIKVRGTGALRAVQVDMGDMPDTAQTLSVLAAFANGETSITGLSTLEHKETMRLVALQTELAKMGIESRIDRKSISIRGGAPKGVPINTFNDHRMAMSFAVAGIKIGNVSIEAPEVVRKSFPKFWDTLRTMGINVEMR
jgi:3-phosphoshikimate 1-carboxyvinyltransferase